MTESQLLAVEFIRNLVLTATGVVAAIVAVLGLKTWRRQLKGHTEYELARRFLRAAYRVRDEIAYVRHMIVSSTEIGAALEDTEVDSADLDIGSEKAVVAVRSRRWKHLQDALSSLDVERIEAEVLWGPAPLNALKPLQDRVSELRRAAMELADRADEGPPREKDEKQRYVQLRRIVNGSGSSQDAFANSVGEAIAELEGYLRPHMKL